MNRVTTVFNSYMDLGAGSAAGTSDLYSYGNGLIEPQILRYHIMTIEPRDQTNPTSIDYGNLMAGVVDMRAGDQVSSYQMDQCGNSDFNTTFEICEFTLPKTDLSGTPSIPVADNPFGYYDQNSNTHYPEHDT
jgi:hypothetical protein